MDLDGMTSPRSSEKLTTRLWRRYGAEAFGLLEDIRADPRMAEVLIEGAEYLRCEIEHAARREMIVKLDDFLRRRSKIALVVTPQVLRDAPGLREACQLLFGADARRALRRVLRGHARGRRAPRRHLTHLDRGGWRRAQGLRARRRLASPQAATPNTRFSTNARMIEL